MAPAFLQFSARLAAAAKPGWEEQTLPASAPRSLAASRLRASVSPLMGMEDSWDSCKPRFWGEKPQRGVGSQAGGCAGVVEMGNFSSAELPGPTHAGAGTDARTEASFQSGFSAF